MTSGLERFLATRDAIVSAGWSQGSDLTLSRSLDEAIRDLAGTVPPDVAVCAHGGYGRGSLALHSDVDLLILHTGSEPVDVARRLLHPLWDAKLKVGNLTHTPRSAVALARVRLHALSTLLTARFLTGDPSVFEGFRERLRRHVDGDAPRIVASLLDEERERRRQEPYRLMAADLKTQRGGVRTLDLVEWRHDLLHAAGLGAGDGRRSDDRDLRSRLNRLRSGLHLAAGRLHDRYDFELRPSAARWLGLGVEELGREILEIRSSIEERCDDRWPEVAGRSKPLPVDISSTRPERRGDRARRVVDALLGELVPDWDRLRDQPHLVPFHRFPVGDHVLATVDEMWRIVDGRPEDLVADEILHVLERPEPAVWAALLHDAGKGRPGDHARVGADLVRVALHSMLGADDATLVGRLVKTHLLLADLATRHDIGDRTVVAWAVEEVVDLTTLRHLYLLTLADSRATGTDTWSPWRAELVRRAFRRLERALARAAMPEELDVAAVADDVVAADDGIVRAEVVAHLSGLDRSYRSLHDPRTIAEHVRMASVAAGSVEGAVVTHDGDPASLVIVSHDRPRLLVDVAGVLAVHGVSILDARLATRSDGVVFDTFEVVCDRQRFDAIASDIRRVLRGGYDIESRLAGRRHAYRDQTLGGVEPHIVITRQPGGGGVVEVEAADRVGLVHDLAAVFDRMGMPVARARLDTRAGVAFDTFHVSRVPADLTALQRALESAL